MITVPLLAISDTDTAAGLTASSPEGGQDFLALLADAVSGNTTNAGKNAPSLADLQTASRPLPPTEKIIGDQYPALHADDALMTGMADTTQTMSLLPPLKSDRVQMMQQEDIPGVSETPSDDATLAGLSALMAMLPQRAPVITATAPGEPSATPDLSFATAPAHGGMSADAPSPLTIAADDITATDSHARPTSQTPPLATAALKADNDSTPSPVAMTVTPVITPTTSSTVTHPVVSVNAQLGTPEWQQSVSQQVTLFTRQGQHTAELKLHPQDLGQVHITLTLDDNQAQLQMMSPHSQVRAALEAALPVLRTQLADNGIQLAQSSISSDGSAGQQQHSAFQQPASQQQSARGRGTAADEDELLNVPATLHATARGAGAVDIFA